MPNGKTIRMQPMAVDVEDAATEMRFPPKYGADTRRVLAQAGYTQGEITAMAADSVVVLSLHPCVADLDHGGGCGSRA